MQTKNFSYSCRLIQVRVAIVSQSFYYSEIGSDRVHRQIDFGCSHSGVCPSFRQEGCALKCLDERAEKAQEDVNRKATKNDSLSGQ